MSKRLINRVGRELKLRKLVPDPTVRQLVLRAKIPLEDIEWDSNDQRSLIKSLGIPLDGTSNECLIEAYGVLKSLDSHTRLEVSNLVDRPLITIDGTTVEVESAQDVFILREVFVDTAYCIRCTQPTAVIDIGANIGTSVLYFASLPHVEQVIGFEPVRPTYQRALANVNRNPHLSRKIELHNFGLGDREDALEIPFSVEKKGNVSLTHDTQRLGGNVVTETVQLKEAATVLEPILESLKGRFVVMKIDCEGGEYPIIDAMTDRALLNRVDCFLIEFHYDGPDRLCEPLMKNGYSVIVTQAKSRIGMIYASKCSAKKNGSPD